jgi:ferredoxin
VATARANLRCRASRQCETPRQIVLKGESSISESIVGRRLPADSRLLCSEN